MMAKEEAMDCETGFAQYDRTNLGKQWLEKYERTLQNEELSRFAINTLEETISSFQESDQNDESMPSPVIPTITLPPPISPANASQVNQTRNFFAVAALSREISADFNRQTAHEKLTNRLKSKAESMSISQFDDSQQQNNINSPPSPSLKPPSSSLSSPSSTLKKRLTKRLEVSLATHRLAVVLKATAAKERLEKRLQQKTTNSITPITSPQREE